MSDIAVRESNILWKIPPPIDVEKNETFTVVAKLDGHVEPQIAEAFLVTPQGDLTERFNGSSLHTREGFNNDETASTYVWFNIKARVRGMQKFQFRLTWWAGRHLCGGVKTFHIEVHRAFPSPFYCRCMSLSRPWCP